MVIALAFVILTNGQAVQDYGAFESQAECEKANRELAAVISKDKKVAGYKLECVALEDLDKPGVKA